MIIKGVNCRKTRSIYYGMAVTSSLGCLTAVVVQLWSLPCWEDNLLMVVIRLFFAAISLRYAVLVVRSFRLPVPKITNESRRMGKGKWAFVTWSFMFYMFHMSYEIQSVQHSVYMYGLITGYLAIKQLNWPARDFYISHVVFTDLLSCLSGYLGYQRPAWPYYIIFSAFGLVSYVGNHILDHQLLRQPFTDFVHSPFGFVISTFRV